MNLKCECGKNPEIFIGLESERIWASLVCECSECVSLSIDGDFKNDRVGFIVGAQLKLSWRQSMREISK